MYFKPTLHTDLQIKTVHEEAVNFYKRFHSELPSHTNPLISNLTSLTIPGKVDTPQEDLKEIVVTIF